MSLRGKRRQQIQRTGMFPGLGACSDIGAQVGGWTQGSPAENHWSIIVLEVGEKRPPAGSTRLLLEGEQRPK